MRFEPWHRPALQPAGGSTASTLTRRSLLGQMAAWSLLACGALDPLPLFANDLRVGQRAPVATLTTLDGRKLSTTDLAGNVVILTFWATWCVPCREELPLLSKYAAEHASQGLKVLGFSLDGPEDIGAVRTVAHDFSFPVGLLAQSSAPGYGRIWRIPVNFTIDREGRLVDDGWRDKKPVWTQERLDRIVTPLLSANGDAAQSK